MTNEFTYIAFISYKREDKKWAQWLHRKLENYKLPSSVRKVDTTLPEKIRPVFRDITDLEPGVLADKIREGLKQSRFLIVICSPRAVGSKYVNEEIKEFIRQGRQQSIIPFIIEGSPNSGNPETECFPPALRRLSSKQELLGANVNEMGRNAAAVKVISRMFDLRFDSLWQRHERERRRKMRLSITGILLILSVIFGTIISFRSLQSRIHDIRDNYLQQNIDLLIVNNDFNLAERLCLEVIDSLPTTDRTTLKKFENTFRKALYSESLFSEDKPFINDLAFIDQAGFRSIEVSDDFQKIATVLDDGSIRVFNPYNVYNHIVTENDHTNIIITANNYKLLIYGIYRSLDLEYKLRVRNLVSSTEFEIECKRVHESPEVAVNEGFNAIDINIEKNRIVTASGDHMIRIWSADHGELLHEWDARKSPPLNGDEVWFDGFSNIRCASFNADAAKIIFVYEDNSIRIWDANSGKELHILSPEEDYIYNIFCSPDNKKFIVQCENRIYIYNADTYKKQHTLTNHTSSIRSVDILNKNTILSVSSDNTIQIWDIDKGMELLTLTGIGNFRISPDSTMLVTASEDRIVRLWDIEHGEELQRIEYPLDIISSVIFSPDMNKLASVSEDGYIKIWDMETGECLRTVEIQSSPKDLIDLEFSDDCHNLVITTETFVESISIDDNSQLLLHGHSDEIYFLKFNHDASLLSSASIDGTICLWNANDGSLLLKLDEFTLAQYHTPTKFSDDNKYFYAIASDNRIYIFDIESGECISRSQLSEAIQDYPVFDNSGTHLIFVSRDDMILVWDIEREQIVHSFNPYDTVRSIWCTHNNTIVILTDDHIQLWDINTGTQILKHEADTNDLLNSGCNIICWSQRHSDEVHIWNIVTNQEAILNCPNINIREIDVSPDGKYLVSSSNDYTVRVWDIETGVELQAFKYDYPIWHVSFGPDSRTLVSAYDKNIKIWDFPPLQELIDKTRERFKERPLTDEERKMYYLQ